MVRNRANGRLGCDKVGTMKYWLLKMLPWEGPERFARYRPAVRLGTRRVEHQLLYSLYQSLPGKRGSS
jgi:hypothetical protein